MKNIECHYKDGSLIFCTTHGYSFSTAHKILDSFNLMGLISTVRENSADHFNVVGRLPVHYDPFKNHDKEWSEVIFQLKRTKEKLENEVERY